MAKYTGNLLDTMMLLCYTKNVYATNFKARRWSFLRTDVTRAYLPLLIVETMEQAFCK